jgi:hypothetical protein
MEKASDGSFPRKNPKKTDHHEADGDHDYNISVYSMSTIRPFREMCGICPGFFLKLLVFMAGLIESSPARPEVGLGLSRKWHLLHQALPGNSPLPAHRR